MFLLELCASVLALCALLPVGEADPLPAPVHFYPYCCCGDIKAPVNDDGSTGQISLTANFKFFNNFYSSLYVNTNGLISFNNPISTYTPLWFPLTGGYRVIAPYWADVDTRENAGRIFYRETNNAQIILRARKDVQQAFGINVAPNRVFIVSWHRVTFYGGSDTTPLSTFQAVLIMQGQKSYVMFNYGDIAWTTGTASNGDSNGLGGYPAVVGFNKGSGMRYYTQFGSLTPDIIDIRTQTNCGVRGRFMFRVDSRDILLPQPTRYGYYRPVTSRGRSAARGKPKRGK